MLVVDVGVAGEHHADRRIDHLAGHAVPVLIGDPGYRIPAPTMELVETHVAGGQRRGIATRGCDQPERDALLDSINYVNLAFAFTILGFQSGGSVAVVAFDIV